LLASPLRDGRDQVVAEGDGRPGVGGPGHLHNPEEFTVPVDVDQQLDPFPAAGLDQPPFRPGVDEPPNGHQARETRVGQVRAANLAVKITCDRLMQQTLGVVVRNVDDVWCRAGWRADQSQPAIGGGCARLEGGWQASRVGLRGAIGRR
jgi:hypothetical protein